MIVHDLSCDKDHRFEGWFASHDDFDRQVASGLLVCPMCGRSEIRKLPSAPYVRRSTDRQAAPPVRDEVTTPAPAPAPAPAQPNQIFAQLLAQLRESAEQCEDVGERFPEEARSIHFGQAEERAIKGIASLSELEALLEEGVSVLPIPPSKDDLH